MKEKKSFKSLFGSLPFSVFVCEEAGCTQWERTKILNILTQT